MNDVECEHGLVRETIVVVDDLERLERCLWVSTIWKLSNGAWPRSGES